VSSACDHEIRGSEGALKGGNQGTHTTLTHQVPRPAECTSNFGKRGGVVVEMNPIELCTFSVVFCCPRPLSPAIAVNTALSKMVALMAEFGNLA